MTALLTVVAIASAIYAGLYHGLTLVMIVTSIHEIRRQHRLPRGLVDGLVLDSGRLPPVSVLVPAYNEQASIVATVRSVLNLAYPDLEVVVISDGSTDRTLAALWDAFDLVPSSDRGPEDIPTQKLRAVFESRFEPRLKVADKRNGGKADALNAAVNLAKGRLVLALDADVVLDRQALVRLVIPFLKDPRTVATSGMIRPTNGCEIDEGRLVRRRVPASIIEGVQVVEYLRAYGIGRQIFNRLNAHLIISGAFGLFDRRVVAEVGGYQPHAVGEDMELVVRMHRVLTEAGRPYRILFAADALCLTEVPHSIRDLGRQRTRWHQGLLSTLRLHKKMALRPRYGAVGLVAFPYFLVELWTPIVEAIGWIVLPLACLAGLMPVRAWVPFVAISVLFGITVSLVAILIDAIAFNHYPAASGRLRLVGLAMAEQLGYRQMTVYFRLRAFWRYYRSIQLRAAWKSPERRAAAAQGAEG